MVYPASVSPLNQKSERWSHLVFIARPISRRCLEEQQIAVGCRIKVESKGKRLSVIKGTREAGSSRFAFHLKGITVFARIIQSRSPRPNESLPMRRLGGRVPVVVRGRESRSHGEGGQINSKVTENGSKMPFSVEQLKGSILEGSK